MTTSLVFALVSNTVDPVMIEAIDVSGPANEGLQVVHAEGDSDRGSAESQQRK